MAIAASLHAAAALAAGGPMPPCGLATLGLLEGLEEVLPVAARRDRRAADGRGLGVERALDSAARRERRDRYLRPAARPRRRARALRHASGVHLARRRAVRRSSSRSPAEPQIRCYSHIDERCAGFFALGLAKASGRPVAIACTSGTAAANLAPAVIEAYEARVPLIVLSADRPAELRDSGAGQTIDQLKLYGSAVKWFVELDCGERRRGAAALDSHARLPRLLRVHARVAPGPVHINFPLREPLVTDDELPGDDTRARRACALPRAARREARRAEEPRDARGARRGRSRRGVVVAGEERDERRRRRRVARSPAPPPVSARRSAGRCSPTRSRARGAGTAAIAHYDALLREPTYFARARAPDLVLRVGDLPTSKPLREWLADLRDVPQVVLDPEGAGRTPTPRSARRCRSIPHAPSPRSPARGSKCRGRGRLACQLAQRRRARLGGDPRRARKRASSSEPLVARELGVLLPESATAFVASSMPVRDVEAFWPVRTGPAAGALQPRCKRHRRDRLERLRHGGGRGARGRARARRAAARRRRARPRHRRAASPHAGSGCGLTIVLLNNSGGGIFDFLPVARSAIAQDAYEEHIATPPGLDFAHAAALYGIVHERAVDLAELP